MQASSSRSSHLSEVFMKLFEAEGVFRLWRGVSSVVLGCVPAHAAYFSIYEIGRKHFSIEPNHEFYLFSTMLTGGVATIAHDFIMTPMDGILYIVIKQRMQLSGGTSVLKTMSKLIKTEGSVSLYRSLPVTLVISNQFMNIPGSALFMTFNENMKSLIYGDKPISLTGYFMCAGLSGSLSAFCTTPLDVVKTRLQTQDEKLIITGLNNDSIVSYNKKPYSSIRETILQIFREEGMRGLWRGAVPRMMFFLPGAAVSWATYEHIKTLLI